MLSGIPYVLLEVNSRGTFFSSIQKLWRNLSHISAHIKESFKFTLDVQVRNVYFLSVIEFLLVCLDLVAETKHFYSCWHAAVQAWCCLCQSSKWEGGGDAVCEMSPRCKHVVLILTKKNSRHTCFLEARAGCRILLTVKIIQGEQRFQSRGVQNTRQYLTSWPQIDGRVLWDVTLLTSDPQRRASHSVASSVGFLNLGLFYFFP